MFNQGGGVPSILQPDAFVKYIKKRNPCFVPEILSCRISVPTVSASTPAAAVSGEELSEDGLERFVHRHLVVFAHVVSAGRTGVDLGFERSLKAFLRRGENCVCLIHKHTNHCMCNDEKKPSSVAINPKIRRHLFCC